jgi:hypothetical protein
MASMELLGAVVVNQVVAQEAAGETKEIIC